MKKYIKYVFSFIAILMLTGCVKYNFNMEVKPDKSVNLELIYAINSSAMEQFGNSLGETDDTTTDDEDDDSMIEYETTTESDDNMVDDYAFLKEKGFNVEEFQEEVDSKKYAGVKISKNYASIDDITKDTEKTIDINKVLGEKETFDDSQFFSKSGNLYKASLLFDFSEEESSGMDLSSMGLTFELKYKVTLPAKSSSNNATEVSEDGKTLTWNLTYGKKNTVEYSFEFPSQTGSVLNMDSNMLMYIGIGLLVLVVIILIVVLSKKKKNTPIEPVNNGTPNVMQQDVNMIQPNVSNVVNTQPVQNVQPVPPTVASVDNQPTQNVEPVQPIQPEVVNIEPTQNNMQSQVEVQPPQVQVTQPVQPEQPDNQNNSGI